MNAVNTGLWSASFATAAWLGFALPSSVQAAPVGPEFKQRICVAAFRYGGAAGGWSALGTTGTGAFATSGTLNSIFHHIDTANKKFDAVNTVKAGDVVAQDVNLGDTFRANIEWVWSAIALGISDPGATGAVEDLPDPFGNRKGDIQGGPAGEENENHLIPLPSTGGSTGSPDIDFILKETVDSECYPVVFINSPGSFAGLTVKDMDLNRGVLTLINFNAFPRLEIAATSRVERGISTLAHELAHAVCLDPAVGGWGDGKGHPPHTAQVNPDTDQGISGLPPHTPEGRGRKVGAGFLDSGLYLRDTVTWFTSVQRSGAEAFTLRQAKLAHNCVFELRNRYSPSFDVAAGGISALQDGVIRWAPAVPALSVLTSSVPKPVDLGLQGLDKMDAFSYDWNKFPPGRFRFKFSVDAASRGLLGSDVSVRAAMTPRHAADEYAAPTGLALRGNALILTPSQFGLQTGDDVNGLEQISPARRHPDINGMRAVDLDRGGILDGGARVYFSVAPGAVLRDAAAVFVAVGNGFASPPISEYADRVALGLAPGDNIDALCVRDNGNGTFDGHPQDEVLFSLSRASPSVANGTFSSSDIIRGAGLGRAAVVVAPARSLGLRQRIGDELDALKCFAPPLACDINRDGKVDRNDIQLIFNARGTPATIPGEPRDVDADGLITVNDGRVCTLLCTNSNCAL